MAPFVDYRHFSIRPFARVVQELQDPVDLAVRDIQLAAADFMIAIKRCRTVDEALALRRRIAAVIDVLNAIESSALDQAGRL